MLSSDLAVWEPMEEPPSFDLFELHDHVPVAATGRSSDNVFIEWEGNKSYD